MKRMLADVCPELINEWSQRNLPITPDSVTHGSKLTRLLCVNRAVSISFLDSGGIIETSVFLFVFDFGGFQRQQG